VRADFYQLGSLPLQQVIAALAGKLVASGERLLVIAEDEAQLARLDRLLWDQGAASFLPHGIAGGTEDSRQPVLLSTSPDAANRARNMLIADGKWRDSALAVHREFYLFDSSSIEQAREAWRSLAADDEVECHYWANENGRWTEKASSSPAAA
jgi:DNA polymerase-3 subunit chi